MRPKIRFRNRSRKYGPENYRSRKRGSGNDSRRQQTTAAMSPAATLRRSGPHTVSATLDNCTSASSGIKRCGGSLSICAMGGGRRRAVERRIVGVAQGNVLASLEERTRPYRGVIIVLAERDGARDCCDACCTCVIFDATRLPGVEVCSCYC